MSFRYFGTVAGAINTDELEYIGGCLSSNVCSRPNHERESSPKIKIGENEREVTTEKNTFL
uniref:SFRICE_032103 n=1 Tax=Spodoptera frugiperda TaxID=7108 RepID=A0A2H1VEK4_SPOFR